MSAAGMQAQELRQAITTNNLSNTSTTGFKRDLAIVQSRLNAFKEDSSLAPYRFDAPKALLNQGGGVTLNPTQIDLTQGSLLQTGNKTDLALEGPGFFQIQGKDQKATLTRDGRFLLDREGNLITAANGKSVLAADGQPIRLNPLLPVVISARGEISQSGDGAATAQLGIVNVTDARKLIKLGQNQLTVSDPADLQPVTTQTLVRQGTLENSSADPVVEMVNMIENQRAFEANARMISFQDQSLQQLNQIGRVA